jgi:hypothetical protein
MGKKVNPLKAPAAVEAPAAAPASPAIESIPAPVVAQSPAPVQVPVPAVENQAPATGNAPAEKQIDPDEDADLDPEVDLPTDDLLPGEIALRESLKPLEAIKNATGKPRFPAVAKYTNRAIRVFYATGKTASQIRALLESKSFRAPIALSNFGGEELISRTKARIDEIKKDVAEKSPVAIRERAALEASMKKTKIRTPEQLAALDADIRAEIEDRQQMIVRQLALVEGLESDIKGSQNAVHALENELGKSRKSMSEFLEDVAASLSKAPIDIVAESLVFGYKWPDPALEKCLSDDALKAMLLPKIKVDAALMPVKQ